MKKILLFLIIIILALCIFFVINTYLSYSPSPKEAIKVHLKQEIEEFIIFSHSSNQSWGLVITENKKLYAIYLKYNYFGTKVLSASSGLNLNNMETTNFVSNTLTTDGLIVMYGFTSIPLVNNIYVDGNYASVLPFDFYFKGYPKNIKLWFFRGDKNLITNPNNIILKDSEKNIIEYNR